MKAISKVNYCHPPPQNPTSINPRTMEAISKVNYCHQPIIPSLYHHRPSFLRPISSLSFRTPPSPLLSSSPSLKLSSSSLTKASSSSSSLSSSSSQFSDPFHPNPKTPKPQLFKTLKPFPFSLLKTTLVAAVTTTALFFARFNLQPVFAVPISPPPTVETSANDAGFDEEKERTLEDHLRSHPEDIEALRSLMEIKIKSRNLYEAIVIIEQLIRLEPNDVEWPLLKAHLHCYLGEVETAKMLFNEIREKDPLRVEAYHGLVMAASQAASQGDSDDVSSIEFIEIEMMIREAMEICRKERKTQDLRDFKLLLAQIQVIKSNFNDALKTYEELVRDEPRDFRPYLCQGIIYSLLKKKGQADENFEKYRRLVPKGHPYAPYFDENVIATKIFAQKVENEKAGLKG